MVKNTWFFSLFLGKKEQNSKKNGLFFTTIILRAEIIISFRGII